MGRNKEESERVTLRTPTEVALQVCSGCSKVNWLRTSSKLNSASCSNGLESELCAPLASSDFTNWPKILYFLKMSQN